jgi:hypothetical protein
MVPWPHPLPGCLLLKVAGDVEALRDLVARYGREVLCVATVAARRTGRSPIEATVDAFLEVFRSPGVPDVRRQLLVAVAAAPRVS